MANPELRQHRNLDETWVKYAQDRLALHLAEAVANGEVQVSAVDGAFGPITEVSVEFFQQRQGLAVDGIIGPDTWAALEADPPAAPDPIDVPSAEPINLRVPFELQLNWEELRLQQMLQEFEQLDLSTHPGARLTFPHPIGPLFGNAGHTWLQLEFNNNPRVYVDATTRAIIGWSGSEGLELGADNEVEAGLRFRDVDLFISGEFDVELHPMVPSGSVSGGVYGGIRFHFGSVERD